MNEATMPDATPRGPYRLFTDRDNRPWLVWKISSEAVDVMRERSSSECEWLMFLGPDGETRRVDPVPAAWPRMSTEELRALVLLAAPFAAGNRP